MEKIVFELQLQVEELQDELVKKDAQIDKLANVNCSQVVANK